MDKHQYRIEYKTKLSKTLQLFRHLVAHVLDILAFPG